MQRICILFALMGIALAADAPFLSPLQAPSTVLPEEEFEIDIIDLTAAITQEDLEGPVQGPAEQNPRPSSQAIIITGAYPGPRPTPMVITAPYPAASGPYPPRVPVQPETKLVEAPVVPQSQATGPYVPAGVPANPGVQQPAAPSRPPKVKLVTATAMVTQNTAPQIPQMPTASLPYPPAVVQTPTGQFPSTAPAPTQTGPYPAAMPSTGPYPATTKMQN